MNLSPSWVAVLSAAGYESSHWSTIGAPDASDHEILTWAKDHGHVVFTHDLDFGAILAATEMDAPSVIQIRSQDPSPDHCSIFLIDAVRKHAALLEAGALVSLDEGRSRVRLLPLER